MFDSEPISICNQTKNIVENKIISNIRQCTLLLFFIIIINFAIFHEELRKRMQGVIKVTDINAEEIC